MSYKTKRHYIQPGDSLTADQVSLEVDGSYFTLGSLADAQIYYWDERYDEKHEVEYANELPQSHPMHGQAYVEVRA